MRLRRPTGSSRLGFGIPILLPLLGAGSLGCAGDALEPEFLEPPQPPIIVVFIAPAGATIAIGDSLQMSAGVTFPPDWRATGFRWVTGDMMVAVISTTGMVHGRGSGTTGVLVIATNDRGTPAMASTSIHVQ